MLNVYFLMAWALRIAMFPMIFNYGNMASVRDVESMSWVNESDTLRLKLHTIFLFNDPLRVCQGFY